ncbi:MAG: L,D-transpeptidase family protein [Candidatus Vogelbacteria bacterium]|nr:L,D-transpeptidase family protein [Candidatus Vogelbacteria bacterium]
MQEKLIKFLNRELPFYVAIPALFVVFIGSSLSAIYVSERNQITPIVNMPAFTGNRSALEYGARPELANAEYFSQVQDKFIDDKVSFISADLSGKILKVYNKGVIVKEVKIKSVGREGSWWETPAGLYKIESKEKNHFSSFGRVYQPWSMVFQGNFFIHGWPYYPDGTPVSSSFSGGCIRLSSEDAKEVYELIKVGTPVLVYAKDFNKDDFKYVSALPPLTAKRYLVADLDNYYVFTEKGSREIVPIASITKLVTALIASEYINLDKPIYITKDMLATTSLQRLKAGESVPAIDLLYPLLLESSNEAANAFSETLGPKRFVGLMNKKASSLGMVNSSFVDPSGIGAENTSTAEDLFQLAKYLKNNRSFVLKLTTGELSRTAYGKAYFGDVQNFNLFGTDPNFLGGKIGQTKAAGETMMALFNVPMGDTVRPIFIAVLDSEDVERDIMTLRQYVKNNYSGAN